MGIRLFAVRRTVSGLGDHEEIAAALPIMGLTTTGPLQKIRLGNSLGLKTRSWWSFSKLSEYRHLTGNLAVINWRALTQAGELSSRVLLLIYADGIVGFGNTWQHIGFQAPVAAWLLLASAIPMILQVASLELALRTPRKPMLPLLASLGIGKQQLLVADLMALEIVFGLLALAPIVMLFSCVSLLRSVLILPSGGIALAMLTLIYASTEVDKPRMMPKLIVAAWFLAAGGLYILN
ncbi:MAG: hypothetical protein PHG00_00035 [Methylococcales bacterium]|nr:hypothetical protein [Methylococcales bacterium]